MNFNPETWHKVQVVPQQDRTGSVNFEGVPELFRLLGEAAELAVKAGIPPEAFTASAWQAYLRASPGLAEHLAEMQFDAALEEMRNNGRLAKA